MTSKDRILIQAALDLNPIDWGEADRMAREANSREAKRELKRIASMKYRQEEASIGML